MKVQLSKIGLTQQEITALEEILKIRGDPTEAYEKLMKKVGKSAAGKEALSEMAMLIDNVRAFGHRVRNLLFFDPSFMDKQRIYNGIFFQIGIKYKNSFEGIGFGGRYDKLIHDFKIPKAEAKQKAYSTNAVGFTINLDKLISKSMETADDQQNLRQSPPSVSIEKE